MRNPRHKDVPETFSKSHILFETELGLNSGHWSLTSLLFALYQANCCYMFGINYSDAEKALTSFVFSAYLSSHKSFFFKHLSHRSFKSYLALSCLRRRWSWFIFQTSGSRTNINQPNARTLVFSFKSEWYDFEVRRLVIFE